MLQERLSEQMPGMLIEDDQKTFSWYHDDHIFRTKLSTHGVGSSSVSDAADGTQLPFTTRKWEPAVFQQRRASRVSIT